MKKLLVMDSPIGKLTLIEENKELIDIREIEMPEWYDEKHLRVMLAVQKLEDALRDIINTSENVK